MHRIDQGGRTRFPFLLSGLALLLLSLASAHGAGSDFDGVWHQQGYGKLLEIRGDEARVFDFNPAECHASFDEPVAELGVLRRISAERAELGYGINRYRLERMEGLPARCLVSPVDPDDSLLNFDSLWHTLQQHYPFFGVRNVEWAELRERFRAQLNPDSSQRELFETLQSMLGKLQDGHVALERPDELEAAAAATAPADEPPTIVLSRMAQQAVLDRYAPEAREHNAGIVRWGMIDKDVGYLQINGMLMLADYGLEPTDDLRTFFGRYFTHAESRTNQYQDEVEGARRLVRTMLEDLQSATTLVVDLRFNGGGKDGAALEFLRPFVPESYRAFSKTAYDETGSTPPQWIEIEPATARFDGNVYLLTSPATASAAEIMVLASLPLTRVQRIGSATEGIFSDSLDKTLPNGWQYTLSSEVYATPDGQVYEGRGIPANHAIDYPRDVRAFYRQLIELAPSADAAIDTALRLSRERAGRLAPAAER